VLVKTVHIFIFYLRIIVTQDAVNVMVKEARAKYRKRILKTAQIIVGENAPKLECAARDISDTGAHLCLSTTYGLPNHFQAIIDGKQRSCRSIWRNYTEMGVIFE